MTIVKTFDKTSLIFDKGNFDNYCVYFMTPQGRLPLKDVDYFGKLKKYANLYKDKVYNDFVLIYNKTTNQIEQSVLDYITQISNSYQESYSLDVIFTVLYMTMVAEECKINTKLGKRIKRLGIYKLLIENYSINEAANFMRGMNWIEIDKLCKERGF